LVRKPQASSNRIPPAVIANPAGSGLAVSSAVADAASGLNSNEIPELAAVIVVNGVSVVTTT
jgi:hypothetical protein